MEITRHGEALTTNGTPIELGEQLPTFTVTNAQAKPVTTQDLSKRLTLISVVPDINTRVCSISTKHFNEDMDAFDHTDFYTISTNTPQEQQSWCAAEGVKKCSCCLIKMATLARLWACLWPIITPMLAAFGSWTAPALSNIVN